jgi:outer membrane protein assembly factor BamD
VEPEQALRRGQDELNGGAYDKAIPLLEKLEGRAAGTPLAQQAQLDRAYAHYKAGEQAQALATLDRFIKLHPTSPALDYALYLKGIVNFNDNLGMFSFVSKQDLSERDQKAAKESFEAFRELSTRFPDSKYAPDARPHDVHRQLAGAVRGARGALLLQPRRLRGRHQPAQNALADYRDVPGAGGGAGDPDALLRRARHAADARRHAAGAGTELPRSAYLAEAAIGQKPWWRLW